MTSNISHHHLVHVCYTSEAWKSSSNGRGGSARELAKQASCDMYALDDDGESATSSLIPLSFFERIG